MSCVQTSSNMSSESSSSPSQQGQGQSSASSANNNNVQQQDYFNYFSGTSDLPSYYPGRYPDSYVSPYQQLYGNNGGSAGAGGAGGGGSLPSYYPPPPPSSGSSTFGSGPANDHSAAAFGAAANYSSYYVAAAAAAAASQYYPPTASGPNPSGINYSGGGSVSSSGYGGNNQTIYHLSDHLPPSSSSISNSSSSSLMDSSPDFAMETAKNAGRKSSLNRGRGKPRRNSDSPVIPNNINRVFIWDLDETIIVYHSLLTGSYAKRYSKDIAHLHKLAQSMESLIFRVADNNFFYNDLEDCDQVHIDDVAGDDNGQDLNAYNFSTDGFRSSVATNETYMASGSGGIRGGVEWMRKLSFRFRKIKENYNLYRNNIGELLGSPKQENWSPIMEELELQTNGWYSIALKCLKLINERSNCVNVLVTQTQLVETLTKVLLFRLGPIFQVENLYSAFKVGMNACFDRITQRFGKKNITYVVIGDGEDEEIAAKKLSYPYWRVSEHKDLDALYNALKLDYI